MSPIHVSKKGGRFYPDDITRWWNFDLIVCTPQEVGGTLIGENRLVVMAGAESVGWF